MPYFIPDEELAQIGDVPEESPHHRPYFLFVGRLERMKGVQHLIEVFTEFRETDLLIAGTGTYADVLKRQAADLPHIHFLGFQPPERLRVLYAHAAASLVPSIGYETFGWTTIEALIHKTPAIAHRMGPLPEVLSGGGGLTYSNRAELLDAVRTLWEDPALRRELGEAGRKNVEENFTEALHMRRYHGLIAALQGREKTGEDPA
jgi:glycosyltransferase involved in cell wall biosynthesis